MVLVHLISFSCSSRRSPRCRRRSCPRPRSRLRFLFFCSLLPLPIPTLSLVVSPDGRRARVPMTPYQLGQAPAAACDCARTMPLARRQPVSMCPHRPAWRLPARTGPVVVPHARPTGEDSGATSPSSQL
ncbi:hypothetical protein BDA96_08G121600 [Sorghum bicolor]|uniref:Uncharacterized protein n=1 Tax=Sorghum bicolor TaxID=4558 RepID=A0A921QIE4_SORBI|nr:hypothetical protein BDA96_08G121600 [Sorghum bicolor]